MFRSLSLAAVVLTAGLSAAAEIKSGPQAGDTVPGPFAPLNINGETPDQKQCLYCRFGTDPVVMVFARCADCPQSQKLVKAIDALNQKNEGKMNSCVVYCSDEEKLDAKLKSMVKDAGLKQTVLAIDSPSGPGKYKVAKDADVTVLVYTGRKVVSNYAFKKGEIKDKDIETIVADAKKLVK